MHNSIPQLLEHLKPTELSFSYKMLADPSPLEIAYLSRLRLFKPLGCQLKVTTELEKAALPIIFNLWTYVKKSAVPRTNHQTYNDHVKFMKTLNCLSIKLDFDSPEEFCRIKNPSHRAILKNMYFHDKVLITKYIHQKMHEYKYYLDSKVLYKELEHKTQSKTKTSLNEENNTRALSILQEKGIAENDTLKLLCYSKEQHLSVALSRVNSLLRHLQINMETHIINHDMLDIIDFLAKFTTILNQGCVNILRERSFRIKSRKTEDEQKKLSIWKRWQESAKQKYSTN